MDGAVPPLVSAFLGGTIVTAAATPLVARVAGRFGVVDHPGGRRLHATATPRLGGVAVALGLLVGAFTYGLVSGIDALVAILSRDELVAFLLPCLLVFCVGLVDDIRGLSPASRIAAEAIAASFLVQGGYVIDNVANPFGQPVDLGIFAVPLTIMWLVGVTNAFNLIDGLDGLLASISFASLMGIAAVAILDDRFASAILAAALGGAVLGFLYWNRHPARIFMGDSGSLLLGFAIAALSVRVARNNPNSTGTLAFHVPLLLCGLPIAETLLTLARRHISGKPYFSGDRSHIHHVLLSKGLSNSAAVRSLALVSVLLTTVAVLSRNWRNQSFLAGALSIFLLAVIALRWLGYLELQVAASRLMQALRQPRRQELARAVTVAAAGEAIDQATSIEELHAAMRRTVTECGISSLSIVFAAQGNAVPSESGQVHLAAPDPSTGVRDPLWLFSGVSNRDGSGRVTFEMPLLTVGGSRFGQLACERPLGAGPSEKELIDYVITPLVQQLRRMFGENPVSK